MGHFKGYANILAVKSSALVFDLFLVSTLLPHSLAARLVFKLWLVKVVSSGYANLVVAFTLKSDQLRRP
ncbi:hypothetical protein V6Z11_D06G146800 [Gossypium hirsutum]